MENHPECDEVDPLRNKGLVGSQIDKSADKIVIVIIIPSAHPMSKPSRRWSFKTSLREVIGSVPCPPCDSLVLERSMGSAEYELDRTPMFAPHFVGL